MIFPQQIASPHPPFLNTPPPSKMADTPPTKTSGRADLEAFVRACPPGHHEILDPVVQRTGAQTIALLQDRVRPEEPAYSGNKTYPFCDVLLEACTSVLSGQSTSPGQAQDEQGGDTGR